MLLISTIHYRQISKFYYPVMGRVLNISYGMFGALFCDGKKKVRETYMWWCDGAYMGV